VINMSTTKKSVIPTEYKEEITDTSLRAKLLMGFAKRLGKTELISPSKKTVVPQYTWDAEPKLRKPAYNYVDLVLTAQHSWVLRRVFEAITRECTRNWGHVEERFKLKCTACETEFQDQVDKCPNCKDSTLVTPCLDQKKRLLSLTKKTSENRNFLEFVRSTIFYELATDDFYWSVVYEKLPKEEKELLDKFRGSVVYAEHPGFIFPISDNFGRLGGYNYFCPVCYTKEENREHDLHWDIRQLPEEQQNTKLFKCPVCKTPMIQTAYVQDIGGKITTRFGKREIVHGSMSRLPPDLFGNSKLINLVKVVKTLMAIDDSQLETHEEGKIGGLLLFPNLDQDRVTEVLTDVKTERQKLQQRDALSGEFEAKKKTALIFVGLEEGQVPVKIPFMDPADSMKTLEFYRLYMNAIDQVFGLSSSIQVSKKGGTKEVKTVMEVKRETAEMHQRLFSSVFNDELLPLFEITDWLWVWNKLESKDKLRDAEITHQLMAAAMTATNAGLNVKFEDDKLTVWGESTAESRTHIDQPNVEEGVTPRRPSRDMVTPFEISPETGEEITARLKKLGLLKVNLPKLVKMLEDKKATKHAKKTKTI